MMEQDTEGRSQLQPVIGEFKGKPVLKIPLVEQPDPETSWHWMTFGKNKAKAIVAFYDAIKAFAEK